MHHVVHASIELIREHESWSLPILFIVSFGESFVGLSLLFPGTTIMIIAGTFARWPFNPHGVLDVWPLIVGAVLGAVSGDAISFWAGRRFGHLVERHWYFVRHPELLVRGYAFFERFGVASVFIGRFFGPVRAVIPLVAGVMEMPWRQFWFANVSSALIWAPSLLLLGTVLAATTKALGAPREWHPVAAIAAVVTLMAVVWAFRKYGVFDRMGRYFVRMVR